MKKLLVVGLALGAVFGLWRKLAADRAERDLWSEATDPV
ncbi:MAG: DLW-39 family protein [Angustibacter sp.]